MLAKSPSPTKAASSRKRKQPSLLGRWRLQLCALDARSKRWFKSPSSTFLFPYPLHRGAAPCTLVSYKTWRHLSFDMVLGGEKEKEAIFRNPCGSTALRRPFFSEQQPTPPRCRTPSFPLRQSNSRRDRTAPLMAANEIPKTRTAFKARQCKPIQRKKKEKKETRQARKAFGAAARRPGRAANDVSLLHSSSPHDFPTALLRQHASSASYARSPSKRSEPIKHPLSLQPAP